MRPSDKKHEQLEKELDLERAKNRELARTLDEERRDRAERDRMLLAALKGGKDLVEQVILRNKI